jgi:hypothetical protein
MKFMPGSRSRQIWDRRRLVVPAGDFLSKDAFPNEVNGGTAAHDDPIPFQPLQLLGDGFALRSDTGGKILMGRRWADDVCAGAATTRDS